jgi:hypothetical protein
MRIDDQVEPLVRAVLDAAVTRDGDRFEAALSAFPDDHAARKGIELALAVVRTVLFDLNEGTPSSEQIDNLAADISLQEVWMQPSAEEVKAFLAAIAADQPLASVVPPESLVILAYLVAANLLASASEPDKGEWWFNYLDQVEAAIDATP